MWRRASRWTRGHGADRSAWSHRVKTTGGSTSSYRSNRSGLNKVGPRRSVSSVQLGGAYQVFKARHEKSCGDALQGGRAGMLPIVLRTTAGSNRSGLNKVGPRSSVSSVQQFLLESLLSRRMAVVTLHLRRKRPMVGVAT